ncbi:MAG: hypothetical protein WAQ28_00725 [Bacteroidia bacterium]|jgi:hypothetical protein
MKTKNLFVIIIFSFTALVKQTYASSGSISMRPVAGEKCFDENTRLINVGIGLGRHYYVPLSTYSSFTSPSFCISYEQPWPKRIGPGYLGVGGYAGYQNAHYKSLSSGYYYEHNWNYIMLTGRAAYHWDVLNSEKAEVYAGSLVGIRAQLYNYQTNDLTPNGNIYKYSRGGGAFPVFTMFAGARWYFAKNIAVYGEAGSGISYITGGITFRL